RFLPYHIMDGIEYDLRTNGGTRRWSTIKETLSTHILIHHHLYRRFKDQIHHLRVSATLRARATRRSTTP
ncbi:MAG: hypothetical protein M1152_01235, partial [Actinobacteria bacterium]|nr:hypothetical protein [Actinomycetota bacterium]